MKSTIDSQLLYSCLLANKHMEKIEKQGIPVFFNDDNEPVAAILFIKGQRVIYNLNASNEEDIIALYEKKDKIIKTNDNKEENQA